MEKGHEKEVTPLPALPDEARLRGLQKEDYSYHYGEGRRLGQDLEDHPIYIKSQSGHR